jgi:hypothetical protein
VIAVHCGKRFELKKNSCVSVVAETKMVGYKLKAVSNGNPS